MVGGPVTGVTATDPRVNVARAREMCGDTPGKGVGARPHELRTLDGGFISNRD